MSVSGVSSTDSLYEINQQNGWQQVMNDFSQVGQSLQSGDLAGAQKAFATLQEDMQNVGQSQSGQSQSSQQQSALDQLGQALQSGDLAGAQQAFAALKTSHHHHHSGGTQGTGGDSGGSSTIKNDFNTLATALQSGHSQGHKRHLQRSSKTCKILVRLRVLSRPAKPVSRTMISIRSQRLCSRAISQAPNRRLHH